MYLSISLIVRNHIYIYIYIYIYICTYLALNNQQGLICHKTKPKKSTLSINLFQSTHIYHSLLVCSYLSTSVYSYQSTYLFSVHICRTIGVPRLSSSASYVFGLKVENYLGLGRVTWLPLLRSRWIGLNRYLLVWNRVWCVLYYVT